MPPPNENRDQPSGAKPREGSRRGCRPGCIVLSAIPIAFIIVLLLIFARLWFGTTRQLNELRDEIRAQGQPVTAAELDDWYAPSARSREAGRAYVKVFDSYNPKLDYQEDIPLVRTEVAFDATLSEDQAELANRHLQANTEYIQELRRLTETFDSVHYPLDFSHGYESRLDHLTHVRTATKVKALEALIAARDDDETRSVAALATAFRIAESLREEPAIMSQLVRIACLHISFNATELTFQNTALSAESLQRLRRVVDKVQCDGMTVLGLIGDRSMAFVSAQQKGFAFLNPDEYTLSDWEPLMKVPGVGYYFDFESFHVTKGFTDLIAIGNSTPGDRLERGNTFLNQIEADPPFGRILSKTLLPGLARVYEAETRVLALNAVLSTALAVSQYTLDHESFPESLQELVPDYITQLPTDPFSDEPVRSQLTNTHFVIYSLGHDRDDDGGTPPPEGEKITDDGDIVFRIPR